MISICISKEWTSTIVSTCYSMEWTSTIIFTCISTHISMEWISTTVSTQVIMEYISTTSLWRYFYNHICTIKPEIFLELIRESTICSIQKNLKYLHSGYYYMHLYNHLYYSFTYTLDTMWLIQPQITLHGISENKH